MRRINKLNFQEEIQQNIFEQMNSFVLGDNCSSISIAIRDHLREVFKEEAFDVEVERRGDVFSVMVTPNNLVINTTIEIKV
jgi:hypothetical protein